MAVPASLLPAPRLPARAESETSRLFEEHSERIFGYCLRTLGSTSEAEDAAQTTFLYAYRALERGVEPEYEYAWLQAIATNVCRWQLRTLSRRGSLTTDLDLDAMPGSSSSEIEVRELRGELHDALASIPESQRKALVLREWRGLESHEVAEELGMSTTATYALLTRARQSAAKALRAAGSRPVLGLDVVFSLGKVKALLAGGTAKVAATALAVGTIAAGGVAIDRAVDDPVDNPRAPAPTTDFHTPELPARVPSGSVADRLGSIPNPRQPAATRPKVRAPVGSAPRAGTPDPSAGAASGSEGSTGTETQPSGSDRTPEPAGLPNPQVKLPGVVDVPVPKLPPVTVPPVALPAVDPVGPVENVLGTVDDLLDDPPVVVPPPAVPPTPPLPLPPPPLP